MHAELRQATVLTFPQCIAFAWPCTRTGSHLQSSRKSTTVPAIEIHGRGWVIAFDAEIVASRWQTPQTGNIWALFVDPAHEGRGYGRRLLEAMVSWLFARGLTKLYLSTAPNTRAARFYDAAGWQFRRILANGEALYELVDPSAP
jgi:GNAT superfamily N-acetyltransferase